MSKHHKHLHIETKSIYYNAIINISDVFKTNALLQLSAGILFYWNINKGLGIQKYFFSALIG